MRRNDTCKHGAMLTEPCDDCAVVPMTTSPPDTKVQSETPDYAKRINDYGERHNLMDGDIAFFQRLVDEALRNERERCAKVAESFGSDMTPLRRASETVTSTRCAIAKAIREGR